MSDGFIDKIDGLKKLIRETENINPGMIQENIYICFANGCLLLTAFMKSNGQKGWSSLLVNDVGQPILNNSDQALIEEMFGNAPWLLPFLKKPIRENVQVGGSGAGAGEAEAGEGDVSFEEMMKTFVSELTADDVSLDLMMESFINKFQEMDNYWKEMPFITKRLNSDIELQVPTTPYGVPYIQVPVPKRPILLFLMTMLDSFRLSRALIGEKHIPLTLIVLFEEMLTGQWRQMILTAAGLLSPSGVAMGVLGKYAVNTWMLIDGTIRTDIVKSLFKGGKSLLIGFMLWCVTTLPPQSYKNTYKKKIDDFRDIQKKALDTNFVCSPQIQEVIKSVEDDPFFRILLELLNVPVTKDAKLQQCKIAPVGEVPSEIADTIGDIPTPQTNLQPDLQPDLQPEPQPVHVETPKTP